MTDLIAELLKANPERSDRAIAEIAKVDHKTVAAKRKTLEATGEIPQLGKRTSADGKARSRPAHATKPPHRAGVTDAEFEDIGPPIPFDDPASTPGYPLGQTGAEIIMKRRWQGPAVKWARCCLSQCKTARRRVTLLRAASAMTPRFRDERCDRIT